MQVALVHDWITGMRGGEHCLSAFLKLYPNADICTLLHVPGTTTKEIDARVKQTSWMQKLPGVKKYYRLLLPVYPLAVASLDLREYDLVISLSHAAAKNVRVREDAVHICYCFTPMRYIWDQAREYFGALTPALMPILTLLRIWDCSGAKRVSHFVAISRFVSARIRCLYHRRATVIFPPVETRWERSTVKKISQEVRLKRSFLCAGALVPYKRVDVAIEACSKLGLPLIIAGDGPSRKKLERIAGPSVRFVGRISDQQLGELLSECRALLFPGIEDFGMVPIECLAAGNPVIGRYGGALRETLPNFFAQNQNTATSNQRAVEECAGLLYTPDGEESEAEALARALNLFAEKVEPYFSSSAAQKSAARFAPERFFSDWRAFATAIRIDPGLKVEAISSDPTLLTAHA